jgi:hypothetical protein
MTGASRWILFTTIKFTRFQSYMILRPVKNKIMIIVYVLPIFPCENKSAVRWRWRKDTAGRYHWWRSCHVAAERVPVFRSLGLLFRILGLQVNFLVYIQCTHVTMCTLSSDLCKIRISPDLSERNLCLIRVAVLIVRLKCYTQFYILLL